MHSNKIKHGYTQIKNYKNTVTTFNLSNVQDQCTSCVTKWQLLIINNVIVLYKLSVCLQSRYISRDLQ